MPADLNDYFKKRKPSKPEPEENNSGGGNTGGGSGFESPFGGENTNRYLVIGGIILVLILAFLTFKPYTIINSGEVGIKVVTGKFQDKPLKPGLHFFIPVFEKIIPVNTRVRMITYSNQTRPNVSEGYSRYEGGLKRNPAIRVMDSRGLDVDIDLAVQYHLRPETAPRTIATWGTGWEDKIINTKVREIVRDVIGKYAAENLPQKRTEIAREIQQRVRKAVESIPGKPVVLDSVELRNIELPPKIKAKIEELQAEKQNVMIAEQQKDRAKREAERKAEIARGEAQKKRIEAQGFADKIRIEATAQAKANKLISQSLTPSLLQLEQIKTQRAFNDALKVNKDAKIFLTPGGAVPNIWIDTKNREQKAVSAQQ
ncbi:SPFH domain-containing protein [Nitratifractor salsuginis]|uniref:SPFH domain, Band 7 family protein n=1 Tax=Nitratifractor salsuginis (strain DSM 16511 / JCM 12458 / E9I37-1) TaxID=749222 RepID=E6X149_NITSE|nr:SPFH domain-containing protein [Nitratifractor salsuginis]ADV45852.1 SPFH domain, Band 7 family protein [Nitratifractor salsuginis DSM 16511]